mmetsp:Transcript_20361/g.78221  ORF Transcript_20361/g.78221 Transcript_20361/m.78221 type:complete len:223 (+) Transcript_20361:376-1044(+)
MLQRTEKPRRLSSTHTRWSAPEVTTSKGEVAVQTPMSPTAPAPASVTWTATLATARRARRSHTRTCPSCAPVAKRSPAPPPSPRVTPSPSQRAAVTWPLCPAMRPMRAPAPMSQAHANASRPPVTALDAPSTATHSTGALCPARSAVSAPLRLSQTLTVWSYPVETMEVPMPTSAEMEPLWPVMSVQRTPEGDHTQIFASIAAEASVPSARYATDVTHSQWP